MDFDSIGDRLKISKCDNVENTKESMEEVPKILSPEICDVFRIFASMMDIKSFVNLAMTSKAMYKRCTEDKKIKINVNVNSLTVSNRHGTVEFDFYFANVPRQYHDCNAAALQQLPCRINLRALTINDCPEPGTLSKVLRYLKELGVYKIRELYLFRNINEKEAVISVIKDFGVDLVHIFVEIEPDILRSILQLNLKSLWYSGPVLADFLVDVHSSIPEINLYGMRHVSQEELMDIVMLIESGSFPRLSLASNAVNWEDFDKLPFDYEGELPDHRPLLFERISDFDLHDYWFLHWNGCVTKCRRGGLEHRYWMEINKCEPWELPFILRKEEDILMDLAQKRPMVYCSANQFRTFCTSLTMIDRSHKGPLPDYRPFYYKISDEKFWLFDENENLMECSWEDGCATWEPFNTRLSESIQPAIAKLAFWKVLNQVYKFGRIKIPCRRVEEFFEDFEKLDFEYSGVLPKERPLVFERKSSKEEPLIVLLDEDRLLQCDLVDYSVEVEFCHCLNRPPILFSAKHVMEILKGGYIHDVALRLDVFRDGFKQLKDSILVLQNRVLIYEISATEFWYRIDELVRKVEWKNGRFLVEEADLRESPPSFLKQVFKYYAEESSSSFFDLKVEQFHSCLEQFLVVPFDYSGPLKNDSPMAFVKKEIRHSLDCRQHKCQCTEVCSNIFFLFEGAKVSKCSWEANEPNEVVFEKYTFYDMPPALKSKEFLKLLMQAKYNKSSRFEWFGGFNDFLAYLEDYTKLPFDYDGSLPEARPIFFESEKKNSCFILRDDETIIKCEGGESSVSFSLYSPRFEGVPAALQGMQ